MEEKIIGLLDEETGERIRVHLVENDYGYDESGEAWTEIRPNVWRSSDSREILFQSSPNQ